MAKKYIMELPANVKVPDRAPDEYVKIAAARQKVDRVRRAMLVVKRGKRLPGEAGRAAQWLLHASVGPDDYSPISYRFCRTNFGLFVRSRISDVFDALAAEEERQAAEKRKAERAKRPKKCVAPPVDNNVDEAPPSVPNIELREEDRNLPPGYYRVKLQQVGDILEAEVVGVLPGVGEGPETGGVVDAPDNPSSGPNYSPDEPHYSVASSPLPPMSLDEIVAKYQEDLAAETGIPVSLLRGEVGKSPQTKSELAVKYPQYYKEVPAHVPRDEVDTYVVNMMFPLNDPTGTLTHARKKLLVPGVRSGGKDLRKDITEARDSLNRWLALNPEAQ